MVKPTIVIVPGSFASASIYAPTVSALRAKGYPAVTLELPSTQKRAPLEPATMAEDADVIKRAVSTLIQHGREVVVLCHSYGGVPTTEALAGMAVKRIIFLTAVAPKKGENMATARNASREGMPAPVGGYLHMDAVFMASVLAPELSWEEGYELALQLPHHSVVSFMGEVTQVAYETIPVTYILTEKDYIIDADTQRRFIKTIEEASGRSVDVVSLDAGHCPNWTVPEKFAEIVMGIVDKA